MRLTATTIHERFRPSLCDLRVWLASHGVEPAQPGPFEQVLARLGERHEADHLVQLGPYVDLRAGTLEERAVRTLDAIGLDERVLYQPVFTNPVVLDGERVELVGIPDFLIRDAGVYRIRDCKLSLHADEKHHPEILRQLELYGLLFERVTGNQPAAIEAVLGDSSVVEVPYDGGERVKQLLAEIRQAMSLAAAPYSPPGWSKCQGCGFRSHCWAEAEARADVALVYGVDQGLARALREVGVTTAGQLIDRFDETALATFSRPYGKAMRRVGKSAGSVLRQARAMAEGREILLAEPTLPVADSYVMFDVEGMPPHLDELDKVYLWGTQLFGTKPSGYEAAVAGFGPDGDRQGWFDFLAPCSAIFDAYGDVPFIHWHHYETVKLRAYVDRYGDSDGLAERVRQNCVDLLPITRAAVVLPEPSYSLKVVERRAGYERQLEEYGGDWSMARYIEATETGDEAKRQAIMDEIIAYNREDLEATWAVFQWLASF